MPWLECSLCGPLGRSSLGCRPLVPPSGWQLLNSISRLGPEFKCGQCGDPVAQGGQGSHLWLEWWVAGFASEDRGSQRRPHLLLHRPSTQDSPDRRLLAWNTCVIFWTGGCCCGVVHSLRWWAPQTPPQHQCVGECKGFSLCPVCLLSGLDVGRAVSPRNVGLGSTVASPGRRRVDVRMPIKPRARSLPDVRGLLTRTAQSWPRPITLHLTEGVGPGD